MAGTSYATQILSTFRSALQKSSNPCRRLKLHHQVWCLPAHLLQVPATNAYLLQYQGELKIDLRLPTKNMDVKATFVSVKFSSFDYALTAN